MGFVRKIGRKIDDEIIQPVVNTVEDIIESPEALLAIAALAIGIPYIPGVTELALAEGAAVGLTAAEAAGLGLTAAEAAAAGLSAAEFAAAAGTAGASAGLLGGAEGLSALDAGMGVYPTTGNIGLEGLISGVEVTGTPPPTDLLSPVEMTGTPTPTADLVSPVEITGTPAPSLVDKAIASASNLSVSDAIRLAGIGATLAGGAKLVGSAGDTGGGGFPIVPVPSDWTSPPPTSVAAFTPLPDIDFGNKEMLRGTQWERLLSPTYNQPVPMANPAVSTNPSNMSFEELTRILGGTKTSVPTQSLTINDVISGIQNQYGQTPKGAVG